MQLLFRRLLAVLTTSALLLGTSLVFAADYDNPWYIAPSASFYDDDKNRGVDDDLAGGQLAFGRALNDALDIEFGLYSANLKDSSGLPSQDLLGFGIDLLFHLGQQRIQPYVLGGIGYASTDINPGPSTGDFTYSAGLGLDTLLGGSQNALRTEARLRTISGSPDLSDMVYSVGLRMPLGSRAPKAPADSDGDGVPDTRDNCPGTPVGTPVDANGCKLKMDSDKDGVFDDQDRCPGTPRGTKVDARGCPMPVVDTDKDGVPDGRDKCPNTVQGAKVDANGCELDSDGDGVKDSRDRCANSPKGVRIDVNGCEIRDKIKLPGIQFELNSAKLRAGYTNALDDAAGTLAKYPELIVEVAGHTDSTGNDAYNLDLSKKRAKSVADYLMKRGVDGSRLRTQGYGETQPAADNSTTAGRAVNRRVVLDILNQE